jgi:hypothetical protein
MMTMMMAVSAPPYYSRYTCFSPLYQVHRALHQPQGERRTAFLPRQDIVRLLRMWSQQLSMCASSKTENENKAQVKMTLFLLLHWTVPGKLQSMLLHWRHWLCLGKSVTLRLMALDIHPFYWLDLPRARDGQYCSSVGLHSQTCH